MTWLTEMSAVLGFLLEQRSLFSSETPHMQQYAHDFGYGFTCLRVFRDWCCVTPKKRLAWCQTRGFSHEVLESTCDFVTETMDKLCTFIDSIKTAFRRDTKAAERSLMQLFLEGFSDDLAVFSGSNHFGYIRLADSTKIRPGDLRRKSASKYALLFILHRDKRPRWSKCALFPPETAVMEHFKGKDNLKDTREKIETLLRSVLVFTVENIPPILMKRIGFAEGIVHIKEKLKTRPWTSPVELHAEANLERRSLTIHVSGAEFCEKNARDRIDEWLQEERLQVLEQVAFFEYPSPGSGTQLEILNTGKMKSIKDCSEASSVSHTFLVYVCCEVPTNLSEDLSGYGEVVRLTKENEEKLIQSRSRLWGKVRCSSDAERDRMLRNFQFRQGVHLTWTRPNLKTDASNVDYVRVRIRQHAAPVKEIIVHCANKKLTPPPTHIVVGNDPCRVWWLDNDDAVFIPNRKYTSNQKITKAVRDTFGHCRVTIDREHDQRHQCFKHEKSIVDNFIHAFPDIPVRYHMSAVPADPQSEFCDFFLDFFQGGKEFLTAYEKAKEEKNQTVRRRCYPWWIHHVEHYSALMVDPAIYVCVRDGIDVVQQTATEKRLGVKIDTTRNQDNMVVLQVHGRGARRVRNVREVIHKVLSPEVIRSQDSENNHVVPFLTSCGGKRLIEELEATFSVKFSHPTVGAESILVYGPPECKIEAKKAALAHVESLGVPTSIPAPIAEQRLYLVKTMMEMYGKDFEKLCRLTGVESLYWDSKVGHFRVLGNDRSIAACRAGIVAISDGLVQASGCQGSDRPVCAACLCPVEGLPFRLMLCGHTYCASCIETHVTIAVKDRSLPIHCIAQDCEEVILLNDIGRSCHYSKQGLQQLLKAVLTLFIAQNGDSCPVRLCPSPDCPGVYFVNQNANAATEFTCKVCNCSLCSRCHVSPFHEGYSCGLWAAREHLDPETTQWFAEDETLRKICPRCGIGIEKADGCFNVHCTNCKGSLCFKCLAFFDESTDCYAHLEKVHGGYM